MAETSTTSTSENEMTADEAATVEATENVTTAEVEETAPGE